MRAYITDAGISSLSFMSRNFEISGKVICIDQQECEGITIKLTQSGLTDFPDKVKRTTQTDSNGKFVFSKVPKLSYGIEIDSSKFCWVKKLHRVRPQDENIDDVLFT